MSVQALHTEESLSHIHSLPTLTASLATTQSAAVIAGCDRAWQDEGMRSLLLSRDAIGDVRKGDRSWKAS